MSLAERGEKGKPERIKGGIYDILAGQSSSGMLPLNRRGKLLLLVQAWKRKYGREESLLLKKGKKGKKGKKSQIHTSVPLNLFLIALCVTHNSGERNTMGTKL